MTFKIENCGRLTALAAAMLALAGCGGGDGGSVIVPAQVA